MAQVLKPAVRAGIEAAALRCFADAGYGGTSVARIATAAGTAPANVYRYFPSKAALLDAVVPADLPVRHDRLLDVRIEALARGAEGGAAAAAELLEFWLDHRLAVVVLLDRAEGTPFADYPAAFVQRLVAHVERSLGVPLSAVHRELLDLVFDNTRRALARILRSPGDREHARALVTGFWSYQVPGLDGLVAAIRADATGS
ncbi:TetR/AcrR family transcriptional regulator [Geodermatophilus siccatus]|nr:TetR/AcrR family transcriptional regulator [Geodermatophilus siccatus]